MDPGVVQIFLAFLVALPGTIVALGGLVATLLLHRRANKKLDKIDHVTNGTHTIAVDRVTELERMVKILLDQRARHDDPAPARVTDSSSIVIPANVDINGAG